MKGKRKRKLPAEGNLFLILFFSGFTVGILFMNIWWNMAGATVEARGIYGLAVLLDRSWKKWDYFLYLLKWRGSIWLLAALSGITVFGVPVAVVGTMGLGGFLGAAITLGLLEIGLKGGILVLGLIVPQFLLYLPSLLILGILIYRSSLQGWKSREIPVAIYRKQLLGIGVLFLLYLLGILAEAYVNPEIVTLLVKKLKIF